MSAVPDTQQAPVLRLEGVTKVYQTTDLQTVALSKIELEVEAGEYVAIAGPSGCGKSTLLAIMGLLETATEGRYWLRGDPVERLSARARARLRNQAIGFVFQSFNLIGELTVQENVELPLSYAGLPGRERRQRATEALARVAMDHRSRHYPAQLSGGQQQRVAVARALVSGPSLLLADEPTGNLDSRNADQVMQLFQELNAQGATICMVTHDPRFARQARRTVHLFDGRIVEESYV